MHTYDTFVALGDSFTEGLEDVLGDDGRHLGWADRVAAGLARSQGGLRYANLAVRGRVLDQVVTEQVPHALELEPALVSFHAGANDLLRLRVDVAGLIARYRQAVATLTAGGATVVLFTVIGGSGGSGRTARLLAERFEVFNATARECASEFGAIVADVGGRPGLRDRRLWHEDRLHLSPEGHSRVAAAVLEALGVDDEAITGGPPGWWGDPLPANPASTAGGGSRGSSRRQDLAADARWVRTYFLPWVGRRVRGVSSGDAVPPKYPGFITLHP